MTKKKEIDQDKHIADVVDFEQIFKVAEHPGLWMMRSLPNANGFVGMKKFIGSETKIVNVRKLMSLGNLRFYHTNNVRPLSFRDVFRNIFDWESKSGKEISEVVEVEKMMEIAVPNYDDSQFKPKHMHRVVNWYQLIIKSLVNGGGTVKKDKSGNIK